MSKNIWIINQYLVTPQLNGDGYRHSYLADHFTKKGHDVTLITSSFSHVPKKDYAFKGLYKILGGSYRTLLIKGNRFKNSKGFPRIISWLLFCFLLFFIPKRKLPKPDIIMVSSLSLLPVINVIFYFKKVFPKTKFVFETRDLWPMTIIELGGYSPNNIFVKFLAWVERLGYEKADHLVSVLIHADQHIRKVLGDDSFKFTWISNGYQPPLIPENTTSNDGVSNLIPDDKFIIGYAGTLGKANAMEYMIEAMNGLQGEICLCILGGGNEKEKLKKMCTANNVIFLDKVPKSYVMTFLKKCDLLYLGWHDSKIYDYGISAQKIFEYMYASRPILMSGDFLDNPISLAKCGIVIPAENIAEIQNAITHLKDQKKAYLDELGRNGKEYLLENFTYTTLADKYIEEVLK